MPIFCDSARVCLLSLVTAYNMYEFSSMWRGVEDLGIMYFYYLRVSCVMWANPDSNPTISGALKLVLFLSLNKMQK